MMNENKLKMFELAILVVNFEYLWLFWNIAGHMQVHCYLGCILMTLLMVISTIFWIIRYVIFYLLWLKSYYVRCI